MHLCCLSVCVQALASLRQKIKKYIKEADFETSVEEFRKVCTYIRKRHLEGALLWERRPWSECTGRMLQCLHNAQVLYVYII